MVFVIARNLFHLQNDVVNFYFKQHEETKPT